jgi:hypothetical protein
MTQLTSDAASDLLYSISRVAASDLHRLLVYLFQTSIASFLKILPYPHRPLVGRTALFCKAAFCIEALRRHPHGLTTAFLLRPDDESGARILTA